MLFLCTAARRHTERPMALHVHLGEGTSINMPSLASGWKLKQDRTTPEVDVCQVRSRCRKPGQGTNKMFQKVDGALGLGF